MSRTASRSTSSARRRQAREPFGFDEESHEEASIEWPDDSESEDDESSSARSRRNPIPWVRAQIERHLGFLAGLRAGWFILALGLYALLLKPVLMGLSWLLEVQLLALPPLLSIRPLEWLASVVTGSLVEALAGYETAVAFAVYLVFIAGVLPLTTTACAQLLPLHTLRDRLARPRLRAAISIGVMGLLYMFAFARLSFFLTGFGLGVLLWWAFETRYRRSSARRAFAVTFGVHACANAAIVLLLVLAGALQ